MRCKKPIEAVATYMGQAYISSVKQHATNAKLVIDRFHVVKRFNEKLTDFRRELQNSMSDKNEAQYLKNTRWLLVSNPDRLNEQGQAKLERVLEVNQPLATVYYLKEKLRMLWSQPSKIEGEKWLENWIDEATQLGIVMLVKFTETLQKQKQKQKQKDGILAFYDERMSSGRVEGGEQSNKDIE
ncbi:transposase [Vibrio tasmaniensis]|uniref:transposase n=1 Tax=Vibrio tasmaniensis TaxID=212663 RepID=UPI00114D1910|nr:transposase [Vibrio tasmaniensis]